MAKSGLIINQIWGTSVVNFKDSSILDAVVCQAIASELFRLVDEQAQRKIVLDFSNVKFMSSQMLGVIVSLNKKALKIKGRLVLCSMRKELMKIFKLTSLDKILEFADDEESALRVLGVYPS